MDASSVSQLLGVSFVAVMAFMIILWTISLALRNASIVDIFWGPAFIMQVLVYFALTNGYVVRKVFIVALVAIWGLRLAIHIAIRNRGKGEDFRYRNWRKQYGARYGWVSFFQVFVLQGTLSWLIGVPLLLAQISPRPNSLTALDVLGVIVWGVGFFFEAVGDAQLARFKADPDNMGKLLQTGLWAYTRHPNYFGDAAQWWGFYLIALSTGGWWSIFSPILMTFLLVRVSGVGMLEKTLVNTKPGFKEYMKTTSAFVPWILRRR